MSIQPHGLIDGLIDAYNRRDAQGVASCFAEDAPTYRHPGGEPLFRGREETRRFYEQSFARLPHARAEVTHRAVLGEFVADYERLFPGDGSSTREALVVYLVRDGLIQRQDLIFE